MIKFYSNICGKKSLLVRTFCTRYSESHEWIRFNHRNKTCTLGITKYASDQLKSIVNINLPDLNSTIIRKQPIGNIESTKTVADIFSDVDGKCTLLNQDIILNPTIVNNSPEDKGWLLQIETNDVESFNKMMTKNEYGQFLKDINKSND
ncbi:hypothetical protein RB653_008251 [Dictyostelium firmibasis]|uniref:Lipoyl-binding domain-containing protein n=1 Tax=Dictyostelium firmibasis TaxID=79012 RepID=A0AAN7TSH5_9MYCE